MIYLLFSTNEKIGSRIIRAATKSTWSHVDIVANEWSLLGAMAFKGVKRYTTGERMLISTRTEIRLVDGDNAKALAYAYTQIGKSYDWTGLIGLQLGVREWHRENKWFCSEFAARVCMEGGAAMPKGAWRITPGDMYDFSRPVT